MDGEDDDGAIPEAAWPLGNSRGAALALEKNNVRKGWASEVVKCGLEAAFQLDPKPPRTVRVELAGKCGGTFKQVTTWFNNRRAKELKLKSQGTKNKKKVRFAKTTGANEEEEEDEEGGGSNEEESDDDDDEEEEEKEEEEEDDDDDDDEKAEEKEQKEEQKEDDDEQEREQPGEEPETERTLSVVLHEDAAPASVAAVPASAVVAKIPVNRELLAVEHPCYVVNADRAVRMLGGTKAVARASVGSSECIECFLRPDDPLSHPLFGVLTPTPGVLLKVTRRKRKQSEGAGAGAATTERAAVAATATAGGNSSSGAGSSSGAASSSGATSSRGGAGSASASTAERVSIEVVGTVRSSYRFEGLCDYQFISHPSVAAALDPSPLKDGESSDVRRRLEPLAEHALRIPPSLFSMYDTPLGARRSRHLEPTSAALHVVRAALRRCFVCSY